MNRALTVGEKRVRFLKILAILFVLLWSVPDDYQRVFYALKVPLYAYACGTIFVVCLKRLLDRPRLLSGHFFALLGIGVILACIGLPNPRNNFDFKFFWIDLQVYSGLVAGYIMVRVIPENGLFRIVRPASLIGLIIGTLTLAAQTSGLLRSQESVFQIANDLAYSAPLLVAYSAATRRKSEYYFWIVAILTYLTFVAAIDVNRTTFLLAVAVVWEIWFLHRARLRKQVMFSIVFALIFGTLVMRVLPDIEAYVSPALEEKFRRNIDEEWRAQEVQIIYQQIGAELAYGWGFGSRYVGMAPSGSDAYNTGFAFAPHIGILAFLQKGGLEAFVFLVILPLVTVIRTLVKRNAGTVAVAASLGTLSYYVLASVSGGWTSVDLFFFGACYSLATLPTKLPAGAPLPTQYAVGATRPAVTQTISQPLMEPHFQVGLPAQTKAGAVTRIAPGDAGRKL